MNTSALTELMKAVIVLDLEIK